MEARIRDSYEFPTDLDEADPQGALGWTIGVIAMASAALAFTNAGAISGWAASFDPQQPGVTALVHAADGWDETTARLGLGAPHAHLHRAWKRMEQTRWHGGGPVVEQAALEAPTINE